MNTFLIIYAIAMSAAILYVGFKRKWFWKKKKYLWPKELGSLAKQMKSSRKIWPYGDPDEIWNDIVNSDIPAHYGSDLWTRRFIRAYQEAEKETDDPKELCWIAFRKAQEKSGEKPKKFKYKTDHNIDL